MKHQVKASEIGGDKREKPIMVVDAKLIFIILDGNSSLSCANDLIIDHG